MPRIKVKVERGNGLQQVITVDTEATKGATLGTDVRLPSGAVATPATFLQWLGASPSSSSGSGSSGPSLSSILTTKGDLATRDTQVQRLPIGTSNDYLRVVSGMPAWAAPAALTKTDDTNVTLTLGGSASTALLNAASLTLGWTGQLGESRGGTAQSSYLQGDMLYASALNTLGKLGIGASGRWLGSSGSAPQWNAPAALTKTDDTNVTLTLGGSASAALLNAASLTLGWTGQLAVSRGGTGKSALGTLSKTDDTNVTLTLGGTPTNSLIESVSLTLGWTGQLGETRGGTHQSSYLTGDILYASALNTLSKLGIGSSGNVLTVSGGVPVWAAPTGGASGANPTASVGLTAVNGVASTFMRSDGAPALDQGIAPSWTALHTFTKARTAAGEFGLLLASTVPYMGFYDTDAATNGKKLYFGGSGGGFTLGFLNDAENADRDVLAFNRSGLTLTTMTYGNSTDYPAHTFYGGATFNSNANASTPRWSFSNANAGSSTLTVVELNNNAGNSLQLVLRSSAGSPANQGVLQMNIGPLLIQALGGNTLSFDASTYNFISAHNSASGNLRSGTYTPTLTGVANVDSTTARVCQWMRVGNVVTVSGSFVVDATTAGIATRLGMSLPIASNLANAYELGGAGGPENTNSSVVSVYGDASNDRAEIRFYPAINASEEYTFTFTYLVN